MFAIVGLQDRPGSRGALFLSRKTLEGLHLGEIAGVNGRAIAIAQTARPVDGFSRGDDGRRNGRLRGHSNLAAVCLEERSFARDRPVPIAR